MNKLPVSYLVVFAAISVLIYRSAKAQPEISLPAELVLSVDDTAFEPSEGWIDSLIACSKTLNIKYRIVSTVQYETYVTTKIRIPQVLSFSEVLQQIVLYYAVIGDDTARSRES